MMNFQEIRLELQSYSGLAKNWDGEGALPPRRKSIDAALLFLGRLPEGSEVPDPMIHPTGNVGLVWCGNNKSYYAELEFVTTGIAYYITSEGQSGVRGKTSEDGMPEHLKRILLPLITNSNVTTKTIESQIGTGVGSNVESGGNELDGSEAEAVRSSAIDVHDTNRRLETEKLLSEYATRVRPDLHR